MGYTHYWTQPREYTPAEFAEITGVVRQIIKASEITIRGPLGNGRPAINKLKVALNGDRSANLDHETFKIERLNPGWDFCKTAREPYDVVVTAILAYLAAYWEFDVDSDGGAEDWVSGVALANDVVGKPVPNPMVIQVLAGEP